jgi:D-alanine-D-alanine ligase
LKYKLELNEMKKLTVGILFGGRSAEHEVSLQSAKNIIDAIDKEKYEVILIGIDRQGRWYLNESSHFLLHANDPEHIQLKQGEINLALVPGLKSNQIIPVEGREVIETPDVVFPVLHGPYGEDGTIQGLLRLADIPFVGADVLGSAVSMDKDVMKCLLHQAGIPQTKFLSYRYYEKETIDFKNVETTIGIPCFVKPANLGSSVGITKVHNQKEFGPAINEAFEYDNKIIIEQYIEGREIECAVLGNEEPIASVPGEVIPNHEFYSYQAKYIDDQGATLEIPASLPSGITEKVKQLAIDSFKILNCEGMARVDFFLKDSGQLLVNEINTIPGFTKISMYPKLWEASGISYTDLIDRLIELALEKHQRLKHR